MRLLGLLLCVKSTQSTLIRLEPIERATNYAYSRNTFASRYRHASHVYIIKNIRVKQAKEYSKPPSTIYIYRVRHQNPDKFQFKFSAILCLRQRLLLASEKALMLLVNSIIMFSKWLRC